MSMDTPQYRFVRQASNISRNYHKPTIWQRIHIDPWLMLLLLSIAAFGLTVLYSASDKNASLVMRQGVGFLVAFTVMFVMAQIPPRIYQSFTPFFYAGGVLLLIAVELVGEVRMGAQRWIRIPGFGSVQPSEFMRLGMPMMIAWFLSRRHIPPNWLSIVASLLLIAVPVALILKQPDLGTSLLIASGGIFVLFLAGLPWWLILVSLGSFAAFVPIAFKYLLHEYQRKRIMTLLDPGADPMGTGWNIMQSKTAIGSGGLAGKGYMGGTQSHLQFLPEAHTDFIIAAYAEEFGLLGVVLLMLLYFAIISRVMYIALTNHMTYNRLLAGAIGMSLFVFIFVNVGMVGGILPVVGVPLPFVSYGGTAVVTLMAGFGLLMSIHTHRR